LVAIAAAYSLFGDGFVNFSSNLLVTFLAAFPRHAFEAAFLLQQMTISASDFGLEMSRVARGFAHLPPIFGHTNRCRDRAAHLHDEKYGGCAAPEQQHGRSGDEHDATALHEYHAPYPLLLRFRRQDASPPQIDDDRQDVQAERERAEELTYRHRKHRWDRPRVDQEPEHQRETDQRREAC
jgi:hypothetical protein